MGELTISINTLENFNPIGDTTMWIGNCDQNQLDKIHLAILKNPIFVSYSQFKYLDEKKNKENYPAYLSFKEDMNSKMKYMVNLYYYTKTKSDFSKESMQREYETSSANYKIVLDFSVVTLAKYDNIW